VSSSLPLGDGARVHARLPSSSSDHRYVSVIRFRGALHCLDSVCYHAGGPLTAGDIEEIEFAGASVACVLCPWHAYPVSLATGEKLYRATERSPDGKLVPAGWCSVGPRQRVHEVEERPDGVYVRLRTGGDPLESDQYAHNEACGTRVAQPQHSHQPRSGAVFRRAPIHSSRGADGRIV